MAMNTGKLATGTEVRRTGLVTIIAGLAFVFAGALDPFLEWSWLFLLAGFAVLLYAVPQLHRHQSPSDGAIGLWGTRLFIIGTAIIVVIGAIFSIWEAVGEPGEPAWANIVWPIGFFLFLAGFVLFVIGSLKARVLDPIGLWLVVVGLFGGVVLDMATGAFFEENGTTMAWGFVIGIPIAGLGLMLVGYRLLSQKATAGNVMTP
jgi:hypothetical protein